MRFCSFLMLSFVEQRSAVTVPVRLPTGWTTKRTAGWSLTRLGILSLCHHVLTSSGVPGLSSRTTRSPYIKLSPYFHLVPWYRMRGSVPPHLSVPLQSQHQHEAQGFISFRKRITTLIDVYLQLRHKFVTKCKKNYIFLERFSLLP